MGPVKKRALIYPGDGTALVPLGGKNGEGKFAVVDKADAWLVEKHNWCMDSGGYVHTRLGSSLVRLHQFLLPFSKETDHIDGDKLNNRAVNLRPVTRSQNVRNCGKRRDNTSGFKGVRPCGNKWRAVLTIGKKKHHLGMHHDPYAAALAYDRAARSTFGEYARTNFPKPVGP